MVTATNPFDRTQTTQDDGSDAPNPPNTFPTGPVDDPGFGASDDPGTSAGDPFGTPDMDASDDEFLIDLSGYERKERKDHIGIGQHLGYVSAVERQTSKAGNPMIVFSATVYRGEWAGKTNKVYCALTPDALWKLDQTLEAIGVQGQGAKMSFAELKARALRTFVTMVVIDGGEYNGRPQTQLDSLTVPELFGVEPGTKLPESGTPV